MNLSKTTIMVELGESGFKRVVPVTTVFTPQGLRCWFPFTPVSGIQFRNLPIYLKKQIIKKLWVRTPSDMEFPGGIA